MCGGEGGGELVKYCENFIVVMSINDGDAYYCFKA